MVLNVKYKRYDSLPSDGTFKYVNILMNDVSGKYPHFSVWHNSNKPSGDKFVWN